jgi:EmrB/QacA subfamily drug resistance transporter
VSTAAQTGREQPPARGEILTHRQIVTILIGLMMGMFLAALDQTIVAIAMRTISDNLGGFTLQAWATTAFLITSTISTPLYGKLSDIYGRKSFFLFAIAVFIVGSALCGLSRDMYQLAAFRALQGIGAGGLFSLALAIIGDIVPPRERAKYQGYFLAVFGSASVLGPVLGGFFAGADSILGVSGWRWIFYINIPIAAGAMAMIVRYLHIPHQRTDHRIDWPGALALVVGLVPLLIVAEQGRSWGWGSAAAITCYAIGAIGIGLFIFAERWYGEEALIPLRLFKGRSFAVGSASSFIIGMAMFGAMLTLPLYLQIVKGAGPTKGGLELIPLVLGIMSGSIISGQAISRTGRYRIFPIVGGSFMLVALLLFSRIGADTPLWQTSLVMVLMGLGLGGNMQPMVLAVQNAVSPREIGVATSSVTFFRSMGGTVGTAVFLSVLFTTLPNKIKGAFTAAAATPQFQAAVQANPQQVRALAQSAGGNSSLNDTSFINRLPDVFAHPFKVGFSQSMSLVFLIATIIMVVGLLVVFRLPELPLRQQSAATARAEEDAAAAADAGANGFSPDGHGPDGHGPDGHSSNGGVPRRAADVASDAVATE